MRCFAACQVTKILDLKMIQSANLWRLEHSITVLIGWVGQERVLQNYCLLTLVIKNSGKKLQFQNIISENALATE
jgi:hypothetical protein